MHEGSDIVLKTERGSGRTTDLIYWASQETALNPMRYIVCFSKRECSRIFQQANDMGLRIAFPVTWQEMSQMRGMPRPVEFAIDSLSLILPGLVPGSVMSVNW